MVGSPVEAYFPESGEAVWAIGELLFAEADGIRKDTKCGSPYIVLLPSSR